MKFPIVISSLQNPCFLHLKSHLKFFYVFEGLNASEIPHSDYAYS